MFKIYSQMCLLEVRMQTLADYLWQFYIYLVSVLAKQRVIQQNVSQGFTAP